MFYSETNFCFLKISYSRNNVHLPNLLGKSFTSALSSGVKLVSFNEQNTGLGKNQSSLDVNPLALFCASSMMGRAVCGWVNPISVNEVWVIL